MSAMSRAADPIALMRPYRDAHGITRWRQAEPLPQAPKQRAARPRKIFDEPVRMRVNVVACSCGCLLAHGDETCPRCFLSWAERDAVRSSWSRDWWVAA